MTSSFTLRSLTNLTTARDADPIPSSFITHRPATNSTSLKNFQIHTSNIFKAPPKVPKFQKAPSSLSHVFSTKHTNGSKTTRDSLQTSFNNFSRLVPPKQSLKVHPNFYITDSRVHDPSQDCTDLHFKDRSEHKSTTKKAMSKILAPCHQLNLMHIGIQNKPAPSLGALKTERGLKPNTSHHRENSDLEFCDNLSMATSQMRTTNPSLVNFDSFKENMSGPSLKGRLTKRTKTINTSKTLSISKLLQDNSKATSLSIIPGHHDSRIAPIETEGLNKNAYKELERLNFIKNAEELSERLKVQHRNSDVAKHTSRSISMSFLTSRDNLTARMSEITSKKESCVGLVTSLQDLCLLRDEDKPLTTRRQYGSNTVLNSARTSLGGSTARKKVPAKSCIITDQVLKNRILCDMEGSKAAVGSRKNKAKVVLLKPNKKLLAAANSRRSKSLKKLDESLPHEAEKENKVQGQLQLTSHNAKDDDKKKIQQGKENKDTEEDVSVIKETEETAEPGVEEKIVLQQSRLRSSNSGGINIQNLLPKERQEIREHVSDIVKKLDDFRAQPERRAPKPKTSLFYTGSDFKKLGELEIQAIRAEYTKILRDEMDYDLLDSLATRLPLFRSMSKETRATLLSNATYTQYSSGSKIIKSGNFQGSVTIRTTIIPPNEQRKRLRMKTLYDGADFGEYIITSTSKKIDGKLTNQYKISVCSETLNQSMTGEEDTGSEQAQAMSRKKCYVGSLDDSFDNTIFNEAPSKLRQEGYRKIVNIEAAESCDLLCIPQECFQDAYLTSAKDDFTHRINLLSKLPFYRDVDPFSLILMANKLTKKVYTMSEMVISIGDDLDRFRIISKGVCRVVSKTIKPSSTGLTLKIQDRLSLSTTARGRLEATRQHSFNHQRPEPSEGKVRYDYITYARLFPSNIVGCRGLFPAEQDSSEKPYFIAKNRSDPAKLFLMADSARVEVFELHAEQMATIPKSLLDLLFEGLRNSGEFDDYDVEREQEEYSKWNEYKDKEIATIMKSKSQTFEHQKL